MPKPRTNREHVQAVREGKDYYSPRLAINETIDHLVDCALVVKNHETALTAETRALDAIGVQVCRELKNRAEMIHALTDRLQTEEAELKCVREERNMLSAELERVMALLPKDNDPGPQDGNEKQTLHIRPELETAQFSG